MKETLNQTAEALCDAIKSQIEANSVDVELVKATTAFITALPLQDESFDVDQAAAHLNVSSDTLRTLVRKRQIPHFRIGVQIFFKKMALDAWIKLQMENSTIPVPAAERSNMLKRA